MSHGASRLRASRVDPDEFTIPGFKSDVRLVVFDKPFLAYWPLLQAGATYFWMPVDQENPTATATESAGDHIKHIWYTAVDSEGGWFLTSDESKSYDMQSGIYKGDIPAQISAFRKMLRAVFSQDIDIANCAELSLIADLGDYYCALPMISKSFYKVFSQTPDMGDTIKLDPCQTLIAAYRIRHKALFQEALIYTLGPWNQPRYEDLKDAVYETLYHFAQEAHFDMFKKINTAQKGLLNVAAGVFPPQQLRNDIIGRSVTRKMVAITGRCIPPNTSEPQLPAHFRNCFELRHMARNARGQLAVENALEPVLKNQLTINTAAEAGIDDFEDFFLFHKIEEFPWDDAEAVW